LPFDRACLLSQRQAARDCNDLAQLLPAVPGNASLIVQLPAFGDIWLQSGDHRQGERDRWSNAVS